VLDEALLAQPLNAEWRPGRSIKRTLYARTGTQDDWKDDIFLGIMESPELAQHVADLHNAAL
jgi:hypothetical protein